LKPARKLDSLELYRSYPAGVGQIGAYPAGVTLLGSSGMPCATASDPEACNEALMALAQPSADCREGRACHPFALTTLGDEVVRIDDQAGLNAILGDIDTINEAAVIAVWNGLTFQCPRTEWSKPLRGTEVMATAQGYTVRSEWEDCGPQLRDTIDVRRDGSAGSLMVEALGDSGCVVGRRPEGLVAALPRTAASRLGVFFANIARLEAAAVFAFQRMARELSLLGAPAELIARCLSAANDELRHARLTAALAQRFGAVPVAPAITAHGLRSRFEIALENAVEGCVRETYGALVAHHQAQLARDPEVAAVMRAIAPDETRHAELAWRVAAWLEPQLSAARRAQLAEARRRASVELMREVQAPTLLGRDAHMAGWPSANVACQLVGQLAGAFGIG
jgi:rubrerythrin